MPMESASALARTAPRPSSNRSFGLVMATFFLLLSLHSAWKLGGWPRPWWPALSVAFAFLALVLPASLTYPNRAWTQLGLVLHRVMNPLVMGLLYFGFVTPFGLVFRWFKRDPLRCRIDPEATTYWLERAPDAQPGDSMAEQF